MNAGAAQAWFVAGTIPLIVAGALHALAALRDSVRPTYFTPIDAAVRPALEGTGIRLRRMFPGEKSATPSMWRIWLGVNVCLGLGLVSFGLLCLLIVTHDFALVERIDAFRPFLIVVAAAYLAVCLRFFFYGPAMVTGSATACFVVATVLTV